MIFRLLGQIVRRGWPLLLVSWVALFLYARFGAPDWKLYAVDQEFAFLRDDAPSRLGAKMFAKAFPEDQFASTIVLVVQRLDTDDKDLKDDLKFIEDVLEPGLRQIAADEGGLANEPDPAEDPLFGDDKPPDKPRQRSIIVRIRTPNALGAGGLLISPDKQALLVVMELTTDFLANQNKPTIEKVEDLVKKLERQNTLPAGAQILVTGSAVMGRDHNQAQIDSVRATELLTIVLVIALLALIYRAPLLAIIPLVTVFVAIKVALGVLALLARAEWITVFPGIEIYITILAYGAGVDYCIFLTARCKEELDHGASPADAVARAVEGVGGALVASAATVICGIAMMMFAEFGKFQQAGLAISLSLVLVLAATLTFSSALVRMAGRWAFWPQGPAQPGNHAAAPSRGWYFRAGALVRIWDAVGLALLKRPGAIWLAAVAVMAPFAIAAGLLYNHLSYDMIAGLPATAPSVMGTRALKEHFSAGMLGQVTMLIVIPGVDFDSSRGREIIARVTDELRGRKDELGLTDVRSLTKPFGITRAADNPFAGGNLPKDVQGEVAEKGAKLRYITALGERDRIGTRLDLVLTHSPFARQSIDGLARIEAAIRDVIPAELRDKGQLYVLGVTASVRDLSAATKRDRTRIELLVLAAVLIVLVLLLRGVWVPLYLLASVLFSYYATLGVAFLVFWLLDPAGFSGIDWKVAIFLFTILIAVGEDYNIFLITRVHEEEKAHGPIKGITRALTRTGPIISSCGIIMAGTFGSLLAGSLTEMKQLGFALAFGVLLDTFVVRPILVPAFLIMLGRRKRRP